MAGQTNIAVSRDGVPIHFDLYELHSLTPWFARSGLFRVGCPCRTVVKVGGMPAERILLVADEADIRELLAHVVIDEGYSVDAVSTVAEQITSAMTSTF
jgi:hypothetical protein